MKYYRLRIFRTPFAGVYAVEDTGEGDPPKWVRAPELYWFATVTYARHYARDWMVQRLWEGNVVTVVMSDRPQDRPKARPRQMTLNWLDDVPEKDDTNETSEQGRTAEQEESGEASTDESGRL